MATADDTSVGNDEILLRRIRPDWVEPAAESPNGVALRSIAFQNLDEDKQFMSSHLLTILQSLGLPAESILNGHPGYGLVQYTAGYARAAGQAIVRDPKPDDPAHMHVVGPKGKGWRRRFATGCTILVCPSLPTGE